MKPKKLKCTCEFNCSKHPKELITAALEMLETLKAVQHLVNSGHWHDETARLVVWEEVDAIIKKAARK